VAPAAYYTQNRTVTVTLDNAGNTLRYSVDGGLNFNNLAAGVNSFNLAADATYTAGSIIVQQIDAFGNSSVTALSHQGTESSRTVITDNTAPNAPAQTDLDAADDNAPGPGATSNSDNLTTQTTGLTFSGTTEAGVTVELYADGVLQGTTTSSGVGAYSFDVNLAAGNSWEVTVRSSDLAGNISTDSVALTVIVSLQDISSGNSLGTTSGAVQVNNTDFGTAENINAAIYVAPSVVSSATRIDVSSWFSNNQTLALRSGEVLNQLYGLVCVGDAYTSMSGANNLEINSRNANDVAFAISGMTVDAVYVNARAIFYFEGDAGGFGSPTGNQGSVWYLEDTGDGVCQAGELTLIATRDEIPNPSGELVFLG
jgi:hypothetical protein